MLLSSNSIQARSKRSAVSSSSNQDVATGSFAGAGEHTPTYLTDIAPLMTKYCVSCHSTAAQNVVILDNYDALIGNGSVFDKWHKVLEYVESSTMPPPGLSAPTAKDVALLKKWVDDGAQSASTSFQLGLSCTDRVPPVANIRRLTNDELANTLADLLPQSLASVISDDLAHFPNESRPGTFDALTTSISSGFLDSQYALVHHVAETLKSTPKAITDLVPCWASAGTDVNAQGTCLGQFLPTFAAKAFRRPLTPAETSAQADALADALENFDPPTALATLVQSVLFSPDFYMLPELDAKAAGNPYQVSDYVVASRLSYALWGTMPDEELRTAAQDGSLSQATKLKSELTRMLASPKFLSHLDHVTDQWLSLDALTVAGTDQNARQSLIASMQKDILMTVRQVLVTDNGNFSGLFTTPIAYIDSPALAKVYGLSTDHLDLPQYVTLDAQVRAGVLTRAGMLSYDATPVLTTIRRAHFVRQNILGQDIGNPPANVTLAPADATLNVSVRDRLTASTKSYQCSFCHNQLNPIGFAFGNYASDGTYQTTEVDALPSGDLVTVPIDAKVDPRIDILGRDTATGAVELDALIGSSNDARLTFAKLWYTALTGSEVDAKQACVVRDMFNVVNADQPALDVIRSYVTAPEFLLKAY